jgi:hypothetical protein
MFVASLHMDFRGFGMQVSQAMGGRAKNLSKESVLKLQSRH